MSDAMASNPDRHPLQAAPMPSGAEPTFSFPLSPETFADMEKLAIVKAEIDSWITEEAKIVTSYMQQFNSFDILSAILMSQLSYNPETYTEIEHKGLAAVVEYASLLLGKEPFSFISPLMLSGS